MGINPKNPRSVLILRSPSGGRHYYVFLDALYGLWTRSRDLLQDAGLHHVKGQIEFFPSTSHGLRLPFGYVPGRPARPGGLDSVHRRLRQRPDHPSFPGRSPREPGEAPCNPAQTYRVTEAGGIETQANHPWCCSHGHPSPPTATETKPAPATDPQDRYLQLLGGIHSQADAEDLLSMGIQLPGTRNQVLNHLAAHLVWFRHMSPEDAADFLIEWAMNPRHDSKDIAQDLERGTNHVAKQIETMCHWYARQKSTDATPDTQLEFLFAQEELDSLSSSLVRLLRRTGSSKLNSCSTSSALPSSTELQMNPATAGRPPRQFVKSSVAGQAATT